MPPVSSLRFLSLCAVLAGAAAAVLAGCGTGSARTEASTQPVPGAVSRVEIDSDAGDVTLRSGDRAQVEQTLRWTGDDRPEVMQSVEGGVLRITARCPQRGDECQAGLVVTVPGASSARARIAAGNITVERLTGEQDLETAAGNVKATGLGDAEANARSAAGNVEVAFAAAPPFADAESSAGNVTVTLPVGPVYDVQAETTAGQTRVEVADTPGARHEIVARSTAGNVTVTHG